jgi:ribosome-binding factor A
MKIFAALLISTFSFGSFANTCQLYQVSAGATDLDPVLSERVEREVLNVKGYDLVKVEKLTPDLPYAQGFRTIIVTSESSKKTAKTALTFAKYLKKSKGADQVYSFSADKSFRRAATDKLIESMVAKLPVCSND